jgi:hypothetical protein
MFTQKKIETKTKTILAKINPYQDFSLPPRAGGGRVLTSKEIARPLARETSVEAGGGVVVMVGVHSLVVLCGGLG